MTVDYKLESSSNKPDAPLTLVQGGGTPLPAGLRVPGPLIPFVATEDDDLYAWFVADLAKSGLVPADVPSWYPVRGTGIAHYCGLDGAVPSGFAVPYLGLDGAPVRGADEFVRFKLQTALQRVLREDGTLKDSGRYLSPTGSTAHVYVPRTTLEILGDDSLAGLPLVITEGEKKAESVAKHLGIPCVALAGVSMWASPDSDKRVAAAARELHPELRAVIDAYQHWTGFSGGGKPVVVVWFDSDGLPQRANAKGANLVTSYDARGKKVRVANGTVHREACLLAARIHADQHQAVATSAGWCEAAEGGGKQGLDDWLVAAGAAPVREALTAAALNPNHRISNALALPGYTLLGNAHADTQALADALQRHETLYVVGNTLARIEPGATGARLISQEGSLACAISQFVQTFDRNAEGDLTPCYPPQRLVLSLLHSDWENSGMRVVDAIAQHPVPVLQDGTVRLSGPGYDANTRLFGAYTAAEWAVPTTPTPDDYVVACRTLGELISEMYLQTPADVSAMLSAILTAVCRPGLPVAPGLVISAPNSGAGKSYIAQVVTALASNHEADVLTLETRGQNAGAEFTKMVLGALATPSPVMLFDEIDDNKIDSPSLRKLITSPTFSGRRLGANEVMSLPTRKLIAITANNVDPTQDSARRFIIVRINPPADPSKRNQNPTQGAVDLVQQNRAKYVQAAIIVVLGGMRQLEQARHRMPVGIDVLSGFPTWSQVVAGPALLAAWTLIKVGLAPANLVDRTDLAAVAALNPLRDHVAALDPTLRQRETLALDPARLATRDLFAALWQFQQSKVPHLPGADILRSGEAQGWTSAMLQRELQEQRHLADRYQRDFGDGVDPNEFAVLQELRAAGLRDEQLASTRAIGAALSQRRDQEVGSYALVTGRKTRAGDLVWHVRKAA